MQAHDVAVFLLQVGVLLLAARVLGELARRLRQPVVVGEILAGIGLGPTVFGTLAPAAFHGLFPAGGAAAMALDGLKELSVCLLLLVAGLEVDLSLAFRQGRAAISTSILGILIPFSLGMAVAWLMFDRWSDPRHATPLTFALFFGTAMSISALPVIAKILIDLKLFRTDLGMLVMTAAMVNDLIGWICFSIVLGLMSGGGRLGGSVGRTIGLTLLFAVAMFTVVRWAVHKSLPWVQQRLPWPGGVIALTAILTLLAASCSEAIGVHAVFGAFLAGVAVGDSALLRAHTREIIHEFVTNIFAPLFFVTIGLTMNFASHFDLTLCLAVFAIACAGKLVGCSLGARIGGLEWRESLATALGLNARGAMEMILGLLAWQQQLIDERMFVALVVMAVGTSLLSGPMMQRVLRWRMPVALAEFLRPELYIPALDAADWQSAVRAIADHVGPVIDLAPSDIFRAVCQRERIMSTALGSGVAVPHARLAELYRPVVAVARSARGIDFNSPDGTLANLIFLLLTPKHDQGAQVQLAGDIARATRDITTRHSLMAASQFGEFAAALEEVENRKVMALAGEAAKTP